MLFRSKSCTKALAIMILASSGFAQANGKFVDGSHVVSGKGKHSEISLTVVVKGGEIQHVETLEEHETESLYLNATTLFPKIIKNNGHEGIDAISGATWSSNGILEAISKLPRSDGSTVKFAKVGSSGAGPTFSEAWDIQPKLGLIKGDYYYEEQRFRQGHLGSMIIVVDSDNNSDVVFAEFNEDGRPNYYLRKYQNVPKRMSEYNFSMGAKKGTAWVQSALTMERLMVEKDKLTFAPNPNHDPKQANKLNKPNRLKYLGLDIVAGASNSIQQSMVPLTAKIHLRINGEGTELAFYQNAEKVLDDKGNWTGITSVLRLAVNKKTKKIEMAHYDEIFANEKSQIKDPSLKKFFRQSKYDSVLYEEPARIGFNVMIDALAKHLENGGSLFDIEDLPATGATGNYAATGFTTRSTSWEQYLKQADILYKELRKDGLIEEHKRP